MADILFWTMLSSLLGVAGFIILFLALFICIVRRLIHTWPFITRL